MRNKSTLCFSSWLKLILLAFLFSNNRHESYFVLSAVLISPPGCKRPPGSSPPSQLRRLDSEGFIRCLSASTPPKCSSSPARIWVWAAGRRFGFHSRAPTALFITREGRWGPGRGTSGKSSSTVWSSEGPVRCQNLESACVFEGVANVPDGAD